MARGVQGIVDWSSVFYVALAIYEGEHKPKKTTALTCVDLLIAWLAGWVSWQNPMQIQIQTTNTVADGVGVVVVVIHFYLH